MSTDIIKFIKNSLRRKSRTTLTHAPSEILFTSFGNAKRVIKPWGFELWLADGTATPYALKIIYLKAGAKTSLQYHKKKSEHNCLISGTIKLHYENKKTKKIVYQKITAGHIIAVKPPGIHRVEALTDVLLVEASTNHLDDVIRLEDDYKRPNGRIKAEHGKL